MNKKIKILITIVLLLILSQWLLIKLVYAHKLAQAPTRFFAQVYNLKIGVIEDEVGDINIYLKDFFRNKDFADKLIKTQPSLKEQDVSDEEISDLVWNKLLKQTWLFKVAEDNNIEINDEDIGYYIDSIGGQENLEKNIADQGVSLDEYKEFLIRPDILEFKVYNYLITNFKDEKGVSKIQEAYALLEVESGQNWDEVAKKYSEDITLSENSFWLAEEELIEAYEPIIEVDVGGFSKLVQIPMGYVIWHLDSISEDEEKIMREIRGIFVASKTTDDFFNDYLRTVKVNKRY